MLDPYPPLPNPTAQNWIKVQTQKNPETIINGTPFKPHQRETRMKTSKPYISCALDRTLPNSLLTIALCIPLLAVACPKVEDDAHRYPNKPIKNLALWSKQQYAKECDFLPEPNWATDAWRDKQFAGVKLLYDRCRSGPSNGWYDVFYPVAGSRVGLQYCAIGSVSARSIWQLSPGPKGQLRIESFFSGGAAEGVWARQEFRPNGIIELGGRYQHFGE
jgi:hypothetical protein